MTFRRQNIIIAAGAIVIFSLASAIMMRAVVDSWLVAAPLAISVVFASGIARLPSRVPKSFFGRLLVGGLYGSVGGAVLSALAVVILTWSGVTDGGHGGVFYVFLSMVGLGGGGLGGAICGVLITRTHEAGA
jgi:hypothetical protein